MLFSPAGAEGQGRGVIGAGNKLEGGLGCAGPCTIGRRLRGCEGKVRNLGIFAPRQQTWWGLGGTKWERAPCTSVGAAQREP
jgi:hypothetical protein